MNKKNKNIKEISLPEHVAIIMDGNGRWAKKRGLPRTEGHREGGKAVKRIVTYARKLGIKKLSLFAFSEQNWERPLEEVEALMKLFNEYIDKEWDEVVNNGIRLFTLGFKEKLPKNLQQKLNSLEEATLKNKDMYLGLAVSYGGREEIVEAVKKIALKVKEGSLDPKEITQDTIYSNMFAYPLGDVDLLIRTGGEKRISNFMLWEISYAELYFTDVLWPDFNEKEFEKALRDFARRQRRFGKVVE